MPGRVTRSQQTLNRIQEAGLSEDEYQSYESRAYELYLQNFEREWLQRREAYLGGERIPAARERLRAELGDEVYDRYLYAKGSTNRVKVQRVLPGSAAQLAGLKPGDVVLSYDGERLFDVEDLRAARWYLHTSDDSQRADGHLREARHAGSAGWLSQTSIFLPGLTPAAPGRGTGSLLTVVVGSGVVAPFPCKLSCPESSEPLPVGPAALAEESVTSSPEHSGPGS